MSIILLNVTQLGALIQSITLVAAPPLLAGAIAPDIPSAVQICPAPRAAAFLAPRESDAVRETRPVTGPVQAPSSGFAVNMLPRSDAGFVQIGASAPVIVGPVEIQRAQDGLFYLDARVNGAGVRFLVDTGASTVVLTKQDAERAGVSLGEDAFSEAAETAGGAARMARVKLSRLEAGPNVGTAVDAAIAGQGLAVSLLGQSWLSRYASVTIRGDRMLLD